MTSMLRKGENGGKMVGAPVRRSKGKGEGGGPVGAGGRCVELRREGGVLTVTKTWPRRARAVHDASKGRMGR
jgi:hypothetical protein